MFCLDGIELGCIQTLIQIQSGPDNSNEIQKTRKSPLPTIRLTYLFYHITYWYLFWLFFRPSDASQATSESFLGPSDPSQPSSDSAPNPSVTSQLFSDSSLDSSDPSHTFYDSSIDLHMSQKPLLTLSSASLTHHIPFLTLLLTHSCLTTLFWLFPLTHHIPLFTLLSTSLTSHVLLLTILPTLWSLTTPLTLPFTLLTYHILLLTSNGKCTGSKK